MGKKKSTNRFNLKTPKPGPRPPAEAGATPPEAVQKLIDVGERLIAAMDRRVALLPGDVSGVKVEKVETTETTEVTSSKTTMATSLDATTEGACEIAPYGTDSPGATAKHMTYKQAREKVHEFVRTHPGSDVKGIEKGTGIEPDIVARLLIELEQMNLVSSEGTDPSKWTSTA